MSATGKKCLLSIFSFLVLSLVSLNAFSQCDGTPGLPGDPDDPGSAASNCPLDTWVMLLGLIAMLFAIWYMHKQKKLAVTY